MGLVGFFASEYGPATWTARNWMGVGGYVVAFFVGAWIIYRIAEPADDSEEGGEG